MGPQPCVHPQVPAGPEAGRQAGRLGHVGQVWLAAGRAGGRPCCSGRDSVSPKVMVTFTQGSLAQTMPPTLCQRGGVQVPWVPQGQRLPHSPDCPVSRCPSCSWWVDWGMAVQATVFIKLQLCAQCRGGHSTGQAAAAVLHRLRSREGPNAAPQGGPGGLHEGPSQLAAGWGAAPRGRPESLSVGGCSEHQGCARFPPEPSQTPVWRDT